MLLKCRSQSDLAMGKDIQQWHLLQGCCTNLHRTGQQRDHDSCTARAGRDGFSSRLPRTGTHVQL